VLGNCKREIKSSGRIGSSRGRVADDSSIDETSDRDQQHKQGFVAQQLDPKIYATGLLQRPRSPYELMAGRVIAAALATGINSDLHGHTIATVTQNVYDTVTGNFLLVPQGSKMLGQYDSQVAYGERRVLLAWTRLIMPDGGCRRDANGTNGMGRLPSSANYLQAIDVDSNAALWRGHSYGEEDTVTVVRGVDRNPPKVTVPRG
jgi:hypothetical protein